MDFRETELTEEEALEKAKEVLTSCLEAQQEQGYVHEDTPIDPKITEKLAAEIDALYVSEDVIAGYYLFEGMEYLPYILVEKSTGDVYCKTGSGNAGNGSYVEAIQKVDADDADLLAIGYYFG